MSKNNTSYNQKNIADYFDEFVVGEGERLVATPVDEVSLYLHTHNLQTFVQSGNKVLDIGAGPGGYTQIIAQIKAQLLVAGISKVQKEC